MCEKKGVCLCAFSSHFYISVKYSRMGFCSNGLVSLFKIFLRAGRRLKTRVRVIVFALLFFKGFLENRTGAPVRGPGRRRREAAEGEPLLRRCCPEAALGGGGNRGGEPS